MSDAQAQAEAAVAELIEGLPAESAALALSVLVQRSVVRLHALARAEASARKDQPDWPSWAQLQNAARNLVLHASTCRDLALRLSDRAQS